MKARFEVRKLLLVLGSAVLFPAFVYAQTPSGGCTIGTTVNPSEANIVNAWDEISFFINDGGPETSNGVVIDRTTGVPVKITGSNDGFSFNPKNAPEMWFFSVGDDLDPTFLTGDYANQSFGGFDVSNGVGDWAQRDENTKKGITFRAAKENYCIKVTNPSVNNVGLIGGVETGNEVFVRLWVFTSEAADGPGRFVRQFFISDGVWVPRSTPFIPAILDDPLTAHVEDGVDRESGVRRR